MARMFCSIMLMLFVCEITLGLDKIENGSLFGLLDPLENAVDERKLLPVSTDISNWNTIEDPQKSEIIPPLKKTQKVKKRPGVSNLDFNAHMFIEPYNTEDNSSLNLSELSMASEIAVNISKSSNYSSLLDTVNPDKMLKNFEINGKSDLPPSDNVTTKNLISPSQLFLNATNRPVYSEKENSEESNSRESSEKSSSEDNSLESSENLKANKGYKETKLISKGDAIKIASKINMENGYRPITTLPINDTTFSGDLKWHQKLLNKTELNKINSTRNSTVIPLHPESSDTDDFIISEFNFTSTPKTSKIMSKPSTATMGEIGKMSSGNIVLVSSIIGIICICVGVGILGYKRIYAYWYRRHYSRVDFLIDGLYEM